ncbi:hypothetical protein GBS0709_05280 [Edwardsiella tarda]|nr:hypothetical protein GBS0709_05280 [Edwardsiella tarda]
MRPPPLEPLTELIGAEFSLLLHPASHMVTSVHIATRRHLIIGLPVLMIPP